MAEVDRILDVIDGGLQTSSETGYGNDHRRDRCVRCRDHDPVEGGDLCSGCRAFLLEDSDEDPSDRGSGVVPTVQVTVTMDTTEFVAAMEQTVEALAADAHIPREVWLPSSRVYETTTARTLDDEERAWQRYVLDRWSA